MKTISLKRVYWWRRWWHRTRLSQAYTHAPASSSRRVFPSSSPCRIIRLPGTRYVAKRLQAALKQISIDAVVVQRRKGEGRRCRGARLQFLTVVNCLLFIVTVNRILDSGSVDCNYSRRKRKRRSGRWTWRKASSWTIPSAMWERSCR